MTPEEYGEKFRTGFKSTVRYLVSKRISRDLAEELAQTAWTLGFIKLQQLTQDDHVLQWVKTIAYNLWLDHLRKKIQINYSAKIELILDTRHSRNCDNSAILAKLLSACSLLEADLLIRRYVMEDDPTELAQSLNTTTENVRVRAHRAIGKIRVFLSR